MNRRFVIAAEGLTGEQERKVRDYLAEHGAWWHWIDNLWLLSTTTTSEDFGTVNILDAISKLNGDAKVLVFEFPEDIDWAARSKPNRKGKSMSDWLRNAWARK